MSKSKFVSQQERIKNLHPDIQENLEKLKKEKHSKEYQYYSEDDRRPLLNWEEYQAKKKEKNKTRTELIIKPNKFNFKNNKLIIKQENYPNLKTLYACGLGLKEVELDFPSLENLYLIHNSLDKIDLSKVPNLKHLAIGNNQLKEIEINNFKHLEEVNFQNNQLSFLSVKNLAYLRWLDCSGNYIEELSLENLNNLKILDADMNMIDNLDFPYLPKLEMLSLRHNCSLERVDSTMTVSSPKLNFLDFHASTIKDVIFNPKYPLENPELLKRVNDESCRNPDGSYNPDVPTEWEDRAYRMKQEREKEWITGDWGFAFEDNPNKFKKSNPEQEIPAANFKEPADKATQVKLTITNMKITGKLVIKGWNNLRQLNVGNNFLEELVVEDCPNLIWLNYAHNRLKKPEATIRNCPELRPENIHNESCDNWDAPELTEEEQTQLEQEKEQEEKKQEVNDKVYLILQKNEEDIDLDELTQIIKEIDINLIDREYKVKLISLCNKKLKEKFPQFYKNKREQDIKKQAEKEIKELTTKISNLIFKAQKALKKGNLKEVDKILVELKTYCDTSSYKENKDLVRGLEQELLKHTQQQLTSNNNEPLSFVISFSVMSVIALTLLAKILQDNIKSFFKKIIKIN